MASSVTGSATAPLPVAVPSLRLPQRAIGPNLQRCNFSEGVFRFSAVAGHLRLRVEAKITPRLFFRFALQAPKCDIEILSRHRRRHGSALAPSSSSRTWSALSAEAQPSSACIAISPPLDPIPSTSKIFRRHASPVADVTTLFPNRWALGSLITAAIRNAGIRLTKHRWYDPFNRNRLKETAICRSASVSKSFNIIASSETFFCSRRVPSPSKVSSQRPAAPGSLAGRASLLQLNASFTFDLFTATGLSP